uniref:Putative secreted protein n=1 Tax=Anopheles marajoara TaxID=58244 RepID=A0A2M4CBD5_9DIPT
MRVSRAATGSGFLCAFVTTLAPHACHAPLRREPRRMTKFANNILCDYRRGCGVWQRRQRRMLERMSERLVAIEGFRTSEGP